MATVAPSLLDQLPAVLRESEFLADFLRAFETVFAEVEREVEALPDLFVPAATPHLKTPAGAGSLTLSLDSAAGICAGDVVQIEDVVRPPTAAPVHVEFARVAVVDGEPQPPERNESLPSPLPTLLTLDAPLRRSHLASAPVRQVGEPGRATTLAQDAGPLFAPADEQVVNVTRPETLPLARGAVIRIDEAPLAEHAQVLAVDGERVTIAPPLTLPHPIGRRVTVLPSRPLTLPPAAFPHAGRSGPELVLASPTLTGEDMLELDTLTGIAPGDVLQLMESDPDLVEFVRVSTLPPEQTTGPGITRLALQLEQPFAYAHAVGLPVGVVGAGEGGTSELESRVGAGATQLTLADPRALGADVGDTLRIGEGAATDFTTLRPSAATELQIAPPLRHAHDAGEPVTRLVLAGGTAFLGWLGGWVGARLRSDRGERWNRDLVNLAGTVWPWRGTRRGVEAFLRAWLRGEARAIVLDLANPLQLGLVSRLGVDAVPCGMPHFFGAELWTNERSSRLYTPEGLQETVQAAHAALRQEKPAHTDYDLRLNAHTMQLSVDAEHEVGARLGDTTLLWDEPLVIPGDHERSAPRWLTA